VNDGAGTAIPIGSELSYHFEAEGPAYLTVVHLDSHGVATLLLPNGVSGPAGAGRKVAAGGRQSFPARTDGFSLRAEPPVGQEHVIVVATAGPIDVDALGVPAGPDGFTVREAADAPALGSRLLDLYLATPVAERAAVHVEQHITGRPGESEYTSVDIVDYFTTRTRSIQRPRLDLHIHFATNSDTLDATALQGLDEVADALRDPRMRDMRFTVAGHTDDTGTPDYNASLSKRRATSVVRYLSDSQGIDPERLEVDFHGEARPLESNATDDGRKLNRRVEFELRR
jgi:outer membrane protein OmpA-like peptidoglycan-associated protein